MGEEKRVLRLGVETIRPNPRQPRRLFDEGALRELAASIRRHGVVQPLVVRRRPDGWELVAGERRLRAARLAGLTAVPCVEAEVDERESALLALVENLQRQDLHYFEEAVAIADYLRSSGATGPPRRRPPPSWGGRPRRWPTSCGFSGCPRPVRRFCWKPA